MSAIKRPGLMYCGREVRLGSVGRLTTDDGRNHCLLPCGKSRVILRVCDFFDVVKNRGCKQNSYDEKLVINSKKSQTLSAGRAFACERPGGVEEPLPWKQAVQGELKSEWRRSLSW